MSDIPHARECVEAAIETLQKSRAVAAGHAIYQLQNALDHMKRRPRHRWTPVKSRRMTREVAEAIRKYAVANPEASNQDIAVAFNVNAARVSEAINNVRWTMWEI